MTRADWLLFARAWAIGFALCLLLLG